MATPVIIQIIPNAIPVGASLELTIYGFEFETGSVVMYNSTPLTTFFNSDQILTADLTLSYLSEVAIITVHNPVAGTDSNAVPFTVFNGFPESPHPYGFFDCRQTYVAPVSVTGSMWWTFDPQTYVYRDTTDPTTNDTITITDSYGNAISYQGSDLAGATIQISGASGTIQFGTSGTPGPVEGGNLFGYRVIDVRYDAPPPKTGYYFLGNRNAEDLVDPTAHTPGSNAGPLAATFPTYFSPSSPVDIQQILPEACITVPYTYQFRFPNASGAITWSLIGSLPAGMALTALGAITGACNTSTYNEFKIKAVDSIGAQAEWRFLLRVFDPPTQIAVAKNTPVTGDYSNVGPMSNGNKLWADYLFWYEGDLYCLLQTQPFSNPTQISNLLLQKSADHGFNWGTVNVGDTSTTYERAGIFRVGGIIYYVLTTSTPYTVGSYMGSGVNLLVVKYNIETNTYTTLMSNGTFSIAGYWDNTVFARPNGDVVYMTTAPNIGDDPTLHASQITLWPAAVNVSTNVPDTPPGTNGHVEVAQYITLMDSTGTLHVIYCTQATIYTPVMIVGAVQFWYVQISPSNTVTTPVLLDPHFFKNALHLGTPIFHSDIGHGYITADQTQIKLPISFAFSTLDTRNNKMMGVLTGTFSQPLNVGVTAPVWTVEIVACKRNNDQTQLSYWAPFDSGMYAFEDSDGQMAIFFTGFDQFQSDTDFGAIWNLKQDRDGTWTYRNRYYYVNAVPITGNQDDEFIQRGIVVPDITSPTGFLLAFAADLGSTPVDKTGVFLLHYPVPAAGTVLGNSFY